MTTTPSFAPSKLSDALAILDYIRDNGAFPPRRKTRPTKVEESAWQTAIALAIREGILEADGTFPVPDPPAIADPDDRIGRLEGLVQRLLEGQIAQTQTNKQSRSSNRSDNQNQSRSHNRSARNSAASRNQSRSPNRRRNIPDDLQLFALPTKGSGGGWYLDLFASFLTDRMETGETKPKAISPLVCRAILDNQEAFLEALQEVCDNEYGG